MTNSSRGTAGWALLTSLLALAGCGDDSPPAGAGGSGGTAGHLAAGAAGVSGKGGASGGSGGTNAGAGNEGPDAGRGTGGTDNRGGTSGSGGDARGGSIGTGADGGSGNGGSGGSSAGAGATGASSGTGASEAGASGDSAGGSQAGLGGGGTGGSQAGAGGDAGASEAGTGGDTNPSDTYLCSINNGGCDPVAECTQGSGTRWCMCPPGYRGDGLTCTLIDGCPCVNGGKCVDFKGGLACECVPGTSGPTCELSTTRLASAGGPSCSIMTDGSVQCWGTMAGASHAAPLPPFVDVSGFQGRTCGLTASGEVYCWTSDSRWTVASEPALLATNAVSVLVNEFDGCTLHTDGQLRCRPRGIPDDIGINASFNKLSPLGAGGDTTFTIHPDGWASVWGERPGPSRPVWAFAVGRAVGALGHSCNIGTDQTLACEGNNDKGQASPPAGTFTAISLGRAHSCALATDGTVQCWGDNTYGQSSPPSGTFQSISAGDDHTCGVRPNYHLECWGRNDSGQTTVDSINTYFSVAAGGAHTCGIRTDKVAKCWGNNDYGQSNAPDPLPTSLKVTELVAGARHTCSIDGASLRCWGDNSSGQAPALENSYGWVSAGREHTCAVDVGYNVRCWGNGAAGQTTPKFQPTDLKAVSTTTYQTGIRPDGTVRSIDTTYRAPAGAFKSISSYCGIGLHDTVRCWYPNAHPPSGTFTLLRGSAYVYCGLHFDGSPECWSAYDIDSSVLHPPAETFTQLTVGDQFACGLRTNGTVDCWGDVLDPNAVPPTGIFRRVAFGTGGYCGIHASGNVECWGDSGLVPPTGPFEDLSIWQHACGLRPDRSLECWGTNAVAPPAGAFQSVTVARQGTGGCAVRDDGSLACWGTGTGTAPPPGSYVGVSLGDISGMAIQSDHQVVCWNPSSPGLTCAAPPDPFVQLSGGSSFQESACGIHPDGTLGCWSTIDLSGGRTDRTNVPPGTFTSVWASNNGACGQRDDGTVACFSWYGGSTEPDAGLVPAGAFDSAGALVRVYDNSGCGVRPNGSLECWGDSTR